MEKPRMTEIHSQDTLHFIRTHRREDVRLLALQAHRYPSVDMPAAITQIFGWQIAKEKIPAWAENEQKAIREYYQQKISEAEPKKYGGKK